MENPKINQTDGNKMANLSLLSETISFSFSDFPEDVQLCILSFLTPSEISAFACTSKRFLSLCLNDGKLWFSICDRRWGSKTQIRKWGSGKITFKQLYKTLDEYENLIGFWRRSGQGNNTNPNSTSPLVFFEWGPSFITGSRVSPSNLGTYSVVKAPFLWMSISPKGEHVNFLEPDCRIELNQNLFNHSELAFLENELIPVNVSHMGKCHVVVEENLSFEYSYSPDRRKSGISRVSSSGNTMENVIGVESGSPPDRLTSEIYQYFANRTSPSGERAWRRQRRREKERHGMRKWEAEHFVKIVNCYPTPSRPLQGLWKGICEEMKLDFYLVAYDDIGGIACRSVGNPFKPFSGYSLVFWTSNTTFIESPLSPEEDYIYNSRDHLQPPGHLACADVSRILNINSSYDIVIPAVVGPNVNRRHVEGRIWQYVDGTFGFGFLRDNCIIDLKHIALDGCLLDTSELYKD